MGQGWGPEWQAGGGWNHASSPRNGGGSSPRANGNLAGGRSGGDDDGVNWKKFEKFIDDKAIVRILEQRERFRGDRNYAASDRLRSGLNKIGVEIDDETKVWETADGRKGKVQYSEDWLHNLTRTSSHELTFASSLYPHAQYVFTAVVAAVGDEVKVPDDDEIVSILERREKARRGKDYKRADAIREDLRLRGVILLDNRGAFGEVEWTTSDGRKGSFKGSG
jgi:cysteinyl-tRNA synthetase